MDNATNIGIYMCKKEYHRTAKPVWYIFLIWNRIRYEMSFSIPYLTYLSVCVLFIYIIIIKVIIILRLVGRTRTIARAANATMSGVIYFKPFMSTEKKMWFILMWIYIIYHVSNENRVMGKKNKTRTMRNTSSNENHCLAL